MKHKEFKTLIDNYLAGRLENTFLEEFEAHYFTCDECFLELKMRERLITKNVPIYIEPAKNRRAFRSLILAFGSLLLFATLFIFIFQSRQHTIMLEKISSFSPPPYLLSEVRGVPVENLFSKAMAAYNKQDYADSLHYLAKIKDQNNPQIQFFTAMNFLLLKDNRNAIKKFDRIIEAMNPSYFDEAIYYKGIALVRINRVEEALLQFKNLAGMFSPYASRAKEMIYKLNDN